MSKRNYLSNYDFVGDSRMHQLTLAQNDVVVVKQGQDISNGWLWGESQGRHGWFPVWAIDYQTAEEPRSGHVEPPFASQAGSNVSGSQRQQQQQRSILTESDSGTSGFDTSANEIMGGHDPRQENNSSREDDNPFDDASRAAADKPEPKSKTKGLFGRFRKSKIIPFLPEKAKTPEWTPEPQIIYEGKVIHDFSQTKKKGLFQR